MQGIPYSSVTVVTSVSYSSLATSNVLNVTISSPSSTSSNPSNAMPHSIPFLISSTSRFKCLSVLMGPNVSAAPWRYLLTHLQRQHHARPRAEFVSCREC